MMLTIAVTCAAANATANKAIVKNSILLVTEFMVFPLKLLRVVCMLPMCVLCSNLKGVAARLR